jgi:predicted O-linked N-acetylglucosamine transferase (SPINDLY family)
MNHTSGNVLEVLQYKPAPLQISYCSFPGTTGLKNIDYKILDNVTNKNTNYYSEKIVCMPNGFHCYRPNYEIPEPIEIKKYENQLKTRPINLCSFANPKKLNSNVIKTWSKILKKENDSEIKLYLRHSSYSSSFVRKFIQLEFEKHEIKEEIVFVGNFPDYVNALQFYNSMDIFLDTFPYNGTTTICEALSMNVPVITLEGETVESRIGSSLLHQCGLEEYVCQSEEEYIEKVDILMNKEDLVVSRNMVKNMVYRSYLMDDKKFIKDYEETLKRLL